MSDCQNEISMDYLIKIIQKFVEIINKQQIIINDIDNEMNILIEEYSLYKDKVNIMFSIIDEKY